MNFLRCNRRESEGVEDPNIFPVLSVQTALERDIREFIFCR